MSRLQVPTKRSHRGPLGAIDGVVCVRYQCVTVISRSAMRLTSKIGRAHCTIAIEAEGDDGQDSLNGAKRCVKVQHLGSMCVGMIVCDA